jgi:hypothetical protein
MQEKAGVPLAGLFVCRDRILTLQLGQLRGPPRAGRSGKTARSDLMIVSIREVTGAG